MIDTLMMVVGVVCYWFNNGVYEHVCPIGLLQCWEIDEALSKAHVQLVFPNWLQMRHNSPNVRRIRTKSTQSRIFIPCTRLKLSIYIKHLIRPRYRCCQVKTITLLTHIPLVVVVLIVGVFSLPTYTYILHVYGLLLCLNKNQGHMLLKSKQFLRSSEYTLGCVRRAFVPSYQRSISVFASTR